MNNRVLENKAYYLHGGDKIVIPPRGSFNSAGDYYATTLHEVGHWTGHFSRLARKSVDEKWLFGSPEYAQEELRAEIASMFLNSMVGIDGKIQNHAKYTRSWLEILKGDKHELFRATRDAEKIVDYILEFAPELREAIDLQIANNILSKESPKPKPDSGISPVLAKFEPLNNEEENERGDPRWQAFEKKVYSSAKKVGIDEASVNGVIKIIEPKFASLIDAAGKNGYSANDINKMLSDRVIEGMRTVEMRRQHWDGFCEQVRKAGAGLYPQSRIENSLQELGGRYWQLISKSEEMGWGNALLHDSNTQTELFL